MPAVASSSAAIASDQHLFSAWRSSPQIMSIAHVHTDIELNYFLSGSGTYFMAGRFFEAEPGRLTVFWAGIPHRLIAVSSGVEYLCMVLPLAWFLSWGLNPDLTQRLLEGELIQEPDARVSQLDREIFLRWSEDLARPGPETRRIVLLEVEARLRRLALESWGSGEATGKGEWASSSRVAFSPAVAAMTAFIGRRFQESLTITAIAEAANLNPNYAMTAFKESCGLSLWDYVTRLRVSHAQRLLLTTDWTVERIAQECGFGSSSRFFAVFRRLCGVTPRVYRVR